MVKWQSQKTLYILLLALIGFVICALFFAARHDKPTRTQDVPLSAKRPLRHVNPKEAYDFELELAFKNIKKPFPAIKTVREIPEGYVRPRRKRQHKMETSEAGALVVLYADFPERPLDMCITPCSLNMNVSDKYNMIIYKYGFEPQHGWVDTGIWPADDTMTIPLGTDWLKTYKEQKKCFDKNEARLSEDQDAEVCNRIPPQMPRQAQKSGHCNVMFNVSKTGYPTDVEALNCTDPIFKAPAINSARLWYYYPKVENNSFVERRNIRNKITFRLTDESGELIPE